MTKRDFFRLIIKLFGLYSLMLSLFTFFPQNISNLILFKDEFWIMVVILGSVLLTASLFIILLFKTDFIIDKLNLDKGFDDEIIIVGDFKTKQILKLAILLIGGFLIVDYFPSVIFEVLNIFKKESSNNTFMGYKVDYFKMIVGIINIIFGLLLMANYKVVSNYLNKK